MTARAAPVGIVVALEIEARCLGVATPSPGTVVGVGEAALVVRTGPGAERAARGARALLAAGAAGLASFGTAAALGEALGAGALLLPEVILDLEGGAARTDSAWRGRLAACLSPAMAFESAPLAEAARVLERAADKARLRESTGAVAADMESAAVGRAAQAAGVPFVALRAVSDPARMSMPGCALAALDGDGRVHVARCLRGLLREPAALVSLIACAAAFGAARRTLARAARAAGPDLRLSSDAAAG